MKYLRQKSHLRTKTNFNQMLFGIVFCICIFTTQNVKARKNKGSSISLTSQYNTYSDLKISNTDPIELVPTLDINVGFRMKGLFNFIIIANQNLDSTKQGVGFGMQVDLPGFFFMGAKKRDNSRLTKRYPVNTSLFSSFIFFKSKAANTTTTGTTVTSRLGISMDVFLVNKITYLSTNAAIYILDGDTFLSSGVGIGVTF